MSTAVEITSVPLDFLYNRLSTDSQMIAFGMKGVYPEGTIPQVNSESESGLRYPGILINPPVWNPDLLGMGDNPVWSEGFYEITAIDLSSNFRVLENLSGRTRQLLHGFVGDAPNGGYINGCHFKRPVRLPQTTNGITFLRVGGVYLIRARRSNS